MNELDEHQLQLHIRVVGWFLILQGALLVVVALFVFVLLMVLSEPSFYAALGDSGIDEVGSRILSFMAWFVGAFVVMLAIPGLVAGVGLLVHRSWARILSIVVAALGLVNIPVGTVFGIYAIWVLTQDKAETYFARRPSAWPMAAVSS
jgi:hypothetical protein